MLITIRARILRLGTIIEALINTTKGAFTKFLAAFDRFQLLTTNFVNQDLALILFVPLAIFIKHAGEISVTGPLCIISSPVATLTKLFARIDLRAYGFFIGRFIATQLSYLADYAIWIFELSKAELVFCCRVALLRLWHFIDRLLAGYVCNVAHFGTALVVGTSTHQPG